MRQFVAAGMTRSHLKLSPLTSTGTFPSLPIKSDPCAVCVESNLEDADASQNRTERDVSNRDMLTSLTRELALDIIYTYYRQSLVIVNTKKKKTEKLY